MHFPSRHVAATRAALLFMVQVTAMAGAAHAIGGPLVPPHPPPRAAFDDAAVDFQRGRFAAAYGQFMRMADRGDARAAAIVQLMHLEGRALFRAEWDATLEQQARWRGLSPEAARHEAAQP